MTDQHLIDVILDERTVVRRNPDIVQEQKIAIFDLLEKNRFSPEGWHTGPYILRLSVQEDRIVFNINDQQDEALTAVNLPTSSFRKLIKEYFLVCESYFEAIKTASPSRIEAIDMGRRGLHDEGSELLRERLEDKIEIDFDTARRLFTLVCVLHLRG
jgi:uncharacterized protein (UPF0262 family)